ncbi:MAG: UDP-N-acetylglucosamine diphosphorylase [Chthoniobacterales bacterium]
MNFPPTDFLDLAQTAHSELFAGLENSWLVLPLIAPYLMTNLVPQNDADCIGTPFVSSQARIGKGTTIGHGAAIIGPAWIGENCEIRPGCYIRENVIVGDNVVLGNSCEFKNCIIFNGAQIPHFSYVGDSIVGYKAHLAAGVILSNMRLDQRPVSIATNHGVIDTQLRKFGAVIGDHAEIGCNAVLSPGSIIGRRSLIYPGTQWRGVLPADSIARLRQQIDVIARRS